MNFPLPTLHQSFLPSLLSPVVPELPSLQSTRASLISSESARCHRYEQRDRITFLKMENAQKKTPLSEQPSCDDCPCSISPSRKRKQGKTALPIYLDGIFLIVYAVVYIYVGACRNWPQVWQWWRADG
ncbi:hypothetical protein P389DRAFT_110754 [Cystobasidium minutum MCA 4210]|uniref:uncharacterized protein n=1 Tax=Cystobasidium minutum MCA 4210 TaxID=1397322 RepID=UPI0034CF9E84|eukprot:jgi/Rhomi1/110754/CE110753_394